MANRMTVELSIAGQGDEDPTTASSVEAFDYEQRLGLPFSLTVDVRFEGDVSPSNAVGRVATLTFVKENQEPRVVVGLVMNVTQLGSPVVGGMLAADAVRFEIASELASLAFSEGCEIFQELDVKEVVTQVLETHGIAADRQKWQLAGTYEKRVYCVRYRESALAFVSRLLEQEGIYFHSEAEDGIEKIVFGDDSPSAGPSEHLESMPYGGHGVIDTASDVVISIGDSAELASGQIVLRDYNFEKPSLDLTTTESADAFDNLSLYDYPGRYGTPALGTHYAKVRLEAEQVERSTLEFEHTSAHVGAGLKVEIEGAAYEEQNGELFVFSSRLSYARTGSGTATERFSGFARALAIATKFRAPHDTPWPRIVGPQTAYIVAPPSSPGETIHTDEHGRCKVKFPWDLSPEVADKASCWMRVTQLQTSGSMIIPRVGWEVIVDFMEGDPDRPIIAGRVYNGLYMPPYALPEGKTRTSLQSATTPGGGGRNEIRLEDKAGAEEIMVHAQHNQNVAVANDKAKTVKNCESRNVTANDTLTIGGNQSAKITKGMRETVTGSQSLSVGGNRDVKVNAVTGINAAGSIAGTVGGNHFEMDGNPLAALLALAAEAATEALQAAASQAMAQVEAAVQSRVDQALGPITELTGQVEEVAGAMEALQDGDPSAVAGVLAGAAGLPTPDSLASAMGGGGDEAAGAGDGGAEPGGEAAEGGEAEDNSMVHALGLDSAVDNAIATGVSQGADALAEALGIGGGGGGGSSEANQAGPEGNVDGIAQEDRAKGPGHQLSNIGGSHSETIGSVKIAATVQTVDANVGGSLSETVGAAKVTMTWGNITADITGDASETALGTITVSRADESLSSEGDKMALVGGAIFEKIGGSHSVVAGGPATFLGLFHKVEASGSITFKCGASEVVVDGSGVTITSPAVAILAAQIQLTKDVSEV